MAPHANNHIDAPGESSTWRRGIEASLASTRRLISKPHKSESRDHKPTSILGDLRKLGFKDVETLLSLFSSEVKGVQDDSKFLLENLVQVLSKLDEDSTIGNKLTNAFINQLWNATPHPPSTSLGTKYKYRKADGSCNNIRMPDLGAANTPYARAVKPVTLQNVALPDPGEIFDSLMDRGDHFEPHPNKISSMLFYLASIIIHDIFRTVGLHGRF